MIKAPHLPQHYDSDSSASSQPCVSAEPCPELAIELSVSQHAPSAPKATTALLLSAGNYMQQPRLIHAALCLTLTNEFPVSK